VNFAGLIKEMVRADVELISTSGHREPAAVPVG